MEHVLMHIMYRNPIKYVTGNNAPSLAPSLVLATGPGFGRYNDGRFYSFALSVDRTFDWRLVPDTLRNDCR